jgi:membrane protein DedA with SNARE-associated domain
VPDSSFLIELVGWFVFLMSAGFGNPIPEEIMIISGGIRTSQLADAYGHARWLMFPACVAGALMADVVLYGLGMLLGGQMKKSGIMARLAPPEKQERIRENFHRYGVAIFVLGRLVPGIRTTLFLTAGAMRLNFFRFLFADGVGALFGTSIFFFLGYGLGSQFKELIEHLEAQINPYKPIFFLALLIAVAGYLAYVFYRHPIPTGDPNEVPLIGSQIAAHMPKMEGTSAVSAAPDAAAAGSARDERLTGSKHGVMNQPPPS